MQTSARRITDKKQAPQYIVQMVVGLEELVLDERVANYWRAYAWLKFAFAWTRSTSCLIQRGSCIELKIHTGVVVNLKIRSRNVNGAAPSWQV